MSHCANSDLISLRPYYDNFCCEKVTGLFTSDYIDAYIYTHMILTFFMDLFCFDGEERSIAHTDKS